MDLNLYNTLGRKKETFVPIKPLPGPVGVYTCGPTVYLYPHIGNLRAYIFSDLLHRTLEYNGWQLKHVINITDVGHLTSDADEGEDKVEKEAKAEGKTAKDITEFYTKAFFDDLSLLNIETADIIFSKATDHIQEQIDLVKELEAKDYTYRTSDGIYYDTSKFPTYGELAKLNLAGQEEGARVEKNPEKKNAADFALWKFSKPEEKRQQEWGSPWGIGFPGWHIECSAMSIKYLGNHFDIHTGGIDHIPVHHTNEIAQSEAATGEKYVNYWLHSGHVLIDGQKMSKSLGNIYRLTDLESKDFDPLAYRFFVLQANYTQTINFTWEALTASQNAYRDLLLKLAQMATLSSAGTKLKGSNYGVVLESWKEKFLSAINDNLNTSVALAVINELLGSEEKQIDKLTTILDFDKVLGLNLERINSMIDIPPEIRELVTKREVSRQLKSWEESDKIRQLVNQQGFEISDTDKGPFVYKKFN